MKKTIHLCYFGIFDEDFSRNAVYIRGLKSHGIEITLCNDRSPGIFKYIILIKKFLKIRKNIDIIIVGYSGHIVVSLVKILSILTIRKPVIFDALCSFYESNILSRDAFKKNPLRKTWCHLIDYVSNKTADIILVETEAQKSYYSDFLKVPSDKIVVVYTGVDDGVFYRDQLVEKESTFTALFRGKFNSESGIFHIIDAAKILASHDINVRIIGWGWGETYEQVKEAISKYKFKNLEFINSFITLEQLRIKTLECQVSLGQFACHERLQRTIPHKAFEALAMGIPLVTSETNVIKEIFVDRKDCYMVGCGDPESIARAVIYLRDHPDIRDSISLSMSRKYEEKYTSREIVKPLLEVIYSLC